MFVSSNLREELKNKVDKLLSDFEKTFRETVNKEKLNTALFPIALVAHDNKKADLLEWAKSNRNLLLQHQLYATH